MQMQQQMQQQLQQQQLLQLRLQLESAGGGADMPGPPSPALKRKKSEEEAEACFALHTLRDITASVDSGNTKKNKADPEDSKTDLMANLMANQPVSAALCSTGATNAIDV
jgi:hypothetical protein